MAGKKLSLKKVVQWGKTRVLNNEKDTIKMVFQGKDNLPLGSYPAEYFFSHFRILVEAAEMLLRQIETQRGSALMFHRCRGRILPYPALLCSMCPPGQEKVEFNPRQKIKELEEQVFLKDRRTIKVERERDELRSQLDKRESEQEELVDELSNLRNQLAEKKK